MEVFYTINEEFSFAIVTKKSDDNLRGGGGGGIFLFCYDNPSLLGP